MSRLQFAVVVTFLAAIVALLSMPLWHRPKAATWQYLVSSPSPENVVNALNNVGGGGWEFVAIHTASDGTAELVFKRPAP